MNSRNIKLGIYGGLAGGVVFGAMMGAMGMLPMIGKMAGHPSAVTGFMVHLAISALIGASFAIRNLWRGSRSSAGCRTGVPGSDPSCGGRCRPGP